MSANLTLAMLMRMMRPHGGSPQGEWPQPPGPSAPGPYGYRTPAPGPTVARVPLQAGERVVYFHKKGNGGAERVMSVLFGILTIPLLIGIYLLYTAIRWRETVDQYYVITNQRVFTVNLVGGVRDQVWLNQIVNVTHRTGNGSNTLIVHSAGPFVMFRGREGHDIARLRPLLQGLRNPAFVQQLPNVPFEP